MFMRLLLPPGEKLKVYSSDMDARAETYTWEAWLAEDNEARERTRRVLAGFKPAPREKPRDPESARILREMGTPEDRIGPVLPAGPDDAA